ncbi:hypothetical protein [Nocardioides acrostichi]|uniref:hypothetical protein n=1 Tax=Nocardioides acrostichi TaxID=2784339 RepID=UPI00188B9108|nr:hypothetical protein [Nocardioides acrostichi]
MWQRHAAGLRGAIVLVVAAFLLSACGGGDGPEPTLDLDGSSSAAATRTPEPTEAAESQGPIPEEPVENKILRGSSVAEGAEQLAIEDVYYDFWSERLHMFHTLKVDRDYWYSLATGDAAQGPIDYVEQLKKTGLRVDGGAIIAINRLTVKGDNATVVSCIRNTSREVDRKTGASTEIPTMKFRSKETLERTGPDWRVATTINLPGNQPCDYR